MLSQVSQTRQMRGLLLDYDVLAYPCDRAHSSSQWRNIMPDTLNAAELRRWAMECGAQADSPNCSTEERTRLLTMRESLLALAENADWLAGKLATPVAAA
jgi:hypothetical protein